MFRLEEFARCCFRGRETVPEEIDALRDLIPAAKNLYRNPNFGHLSAARQRCADRRYAGALPHRRPHQADRRAHGHARKQERSPDAQIAEDAHRIGGRRSAVPFHVQLAPDRGHHPRDDRQHLPRAASRSPGDLLRDGRHAVRSGQFRLFGAGAPGLRPRIVERGQAATSVAVRRSASLYAGRRPPRLRATRHALSRIAKEGRKYGCYLGVVTQRPGELDPTILSQCSTFFAMRHANEQDQAIIRSAIADSSASTLAFLSSMGQREAIALAKAWRRPCD